MPAALRFLPALSVCLVVGAAAVWTVALRDRRWDRCDDPAALANTLAIAGTDTAVPKPIGIKDGNFLWIHGKLQPGPIGAFSYRVVRSDRPALLQTNWVGTIDFPMDPGEISDERLSVDGLSVPIRIARSHFGQRTHVAATLSVYDRMPVASLLPQQLTTAPQQLVRGTLPLTLYVVDGFSLPGDEVQVEGPAREWLTAAWRRHREICGR